MKKLTIIAATAFLAVSFTSCKKDYTCECTYSNTALNSTSTVKTTKKDAEDKCNTLNTAASPVGGTCKLK